MAIHLDVYVSPYKPIANLLLRPGSDGRPVPLNRAFPSWDNRELATFPASSASLISGEKEAVLIDALITTAEVAERWILGTGQRLFTIHLSHHRPHVGIDIL